MPVKHKDNKSERIQIYFDCICGIVSSIVSLFGIFLVTLQKGILNPTNFTLGISFCIGYLVVSIFMIGLGIYTWYREKNTDPDAIPKKKLKAPIAS